MPTKSTLQNACWNFLLEKIESDQVSRVIESTPPTSDSEPSVLERNEVFEDATDRDSFCRVNLRFSPSLNPSRRIYPENS